VAITSPTRRDAIDRLSCFGCLIAPRVAETRDAALGDDDVRHLQEGVAAKHEVYRTVHVGYRATPARHEDSEVTQVAEHARESTALVVGLIGVKGREPCTELLKLRSRQSGALSAVHREVVQVLGVVKPQADRLKLLCGVSVEGGCREHDRGI
jgi:hypothetical protein